MSYYAIFIEVNGPFSVISDSVIQGRAYLIFLALSGAGGGGGGWRFALICSWALIRAFTVFQFCHGEFFH